VVLQSKSFRSTAIQGVRITSLHNLRPCATGGLTSGNSWQPQSQVFTHEMRLYCCDTYVSFFYYFLVEISFIGELDVILAIVMDLIEQRAIAIEILCSTP
jgi:hypothetical protein